ncbi:MAG: hypothetical protein J5520_08445 [Bacteroidales bacterium]|nr:hypothetical protein [Bacteroidales bacterium]
MKPKNYLLPYSCKKVGMWMFLPFAALCICALLDVKLPDIEVPWIGLGDNFFYHGTANLVAEVTMTGFLVSLSLIALSREKDEDEMTGQIRMQSFVWSLWFTSFVLALGILFVMGLIFLDFVLAAIYLFYIVYILKFNLTMRSVRRELK